MIVLRIQDDQICIRCNDAALAHRIAAEFAGFLDRQPPGSGAYSFSFMLGRVPQVPRVRSLRINRWCRIGVSRGRRIIIYKGGAWGLQNASRRRYRLVCPDRDLLYELAYLAVMSAAGAIFDRTGSYRVHALGFLYRQNPGLMVMDSGKGKTMLAMEMVHSGGFTLFSDDLPLVDKTLCLRAFPHRFSVRIDTALACRMPQAEVFLRRAHGPKYVYPLEMGCHEAQGKALGHVFIGSAGKDACVRPMSRFRAARFLVKNMVIGFGLPQGLEFMLPVSCREAFSLAGIIFGRISCATKMLCRLKFHEFKLAPLPAENISKITEFFHEKTRC